MNIRNQVRILAMASMLALAVVSVPVGHVHAQPKGHNEGATCIGDNDLMYNEGDTYTDSSGNKMVCTHWGDWLMVPLVLHLPRGPVAPLPIHGIFGP